MKTILILAILATWFIISVMNQLPGDSWKWFRGWDPFALIPFWSFFAPNPGMTDYHLLYRDRWIGGSFGEWREIPLAGPKSVRSALWNPDKRKRKALFDMVHDLIKHSKKMERHKLCVTLPYILIAHYIASLPHNPLADATQFMVMETHGFRDVVGPEPILVSALQGLE